MSLGETFGMWIDGLNTARDYLGVYELLQKDRDTACQMISHLVENQPPAVLDRFEAILLQQSLVMIDPVGRRRVVELYGWLKVAETQHYGQFRGFLPPA